MIVDRRAWETKNINYNIYIERANLLTAYLSSKP